MSAGGGERQVCRTLLRELRRRVGPSWSPRPPAVAELWGTGGYLEPSSPAAARWGLRPLAPWLRHRLRAALAANPAEGRLNEVFQHLLGSDSSGGVSDDGQRVLEFIRQQGALADCTSVSEEGGLRIEAVSGFVGLSQGSHVFTYNMRFTNTGSQRLRVLGRQYDFREDSGDLTTQIKMETPEAAGVVGFTPLLEPGASFEFGSGVQLKTRLGCVTGRFLVVEEPDLEGKEARTHAQMEKAELMLRFVYFKGLGTRQFYLPLGTLRFNSEVPCAQPGRMGQAPGE